MTDKECTEQGVATLEEAELDTARGGSLNFTKIEQKAAAAPMESLSLNFTKIQY